MRQRRLRWWWWLALAVAGVVGGEAGATTIFLVESPISNIGVMNATFRSTSAPPFQSTLEPTDPLAIRQLAGTFEADPTTGELISAAVTLLGDPIQADQIVLDSHGDPRDIGDVTLTGLAFLVDELGFATITAGFLEFDLSVGNRRIRSTAPMPLAGAMSAASNMGAPPSTSGSGDTLRAIVPFFFPFENLPVTTGGLAGFQLLGTAQGPVVPEPGTLATVAGGLLALNCHRRRIR